MRNKDPKRRNTQGETPAGYVRDPHKILRMTPEEAARQRKAANALRPKNPPSGREIIRAREKRYFASNDLVTEGALQASMARHPHPLDVMQDECHWCKLERRIFAKGHMASLRPSPAWWRRFVAEQREPPGSPRQWTELKITRSDGRWWVVRVTETLDLREPMTGEGVYSVEPWGSGMSCRASDLSRLNIRHSRQHGTTPGTAPGGRRA
jgi:hypothetical protein